MKNLLPEEVTTDYVGGGVDFSESLMLSSFKIKITQGGGSHILLVLQVFQHGPVGRIFIVGQEKPPSWHPNFVYTSKDDPTLEIKKFRSNIN